MIKKAGSLLLAAAMTVSMLGISGSAVLADDTNVVTETTIGAEDPAGVTEGTIEADDGASVILESGGAEEAIPEASPAEPEETEGALYADDGVHYTNPSDKEMVPGDSFHIDRRSGHGWVEDGDDFDFEITDVKPVSENWDSVIEIEKGSDDESWCWDIYTKDVGTATLNIIGKRADNGNKVSYNIVVDVKEDIYGFVFVSSEDGREYYMPGEEYTLVALPYHQSSVPERDGDLSKITVEWEIREGGEYISSLEPIVGEDGIRLAKITFGALPPEQEPADIWVAPVMKDEKGNTLAESRGWVVSLAHRFSEIFPTFINSDMVPGSSEKVTVELRDYDDAANGYETRKNVQFRWYYDPESVVVLDSTGSRVGGHVGEYVESDHATADPVTGTCDFTIKRLQGQGDEIMLLAVDKDDKSIEFSRRAYELWDKNTHISAEPHEMDVFTDSDIVPEIMFNTAELGDDWQSWLEIAFQVGEWQGDHYGAMLTEGKDYTVTTGEGRIDVALTDSYMNSLEDDQDVRIWAGIYSKGTEHTDENLLNDADGYLCIRKAYENYDYIEDFAMLPGWGGHIDGKMRVRVRNSQYPESEEFECIVKDVKIKSDNPWDPEKGPVVKNFERKGETPDEYEWEFDVDNYGEATFTVTYLDYDGKTEKSYEFTVYVSTDVYEANLFSVGGAWIALPGEKLELYADAIHKYLDENGDYQEDKNGIGYRWILEYGGEYAELTPSTTDPSYATLSFYDLPQGWNELHENVKVGVQILNAQGMDEYYRSEEFWVKTEYIVQTPFELDRNLEIGGSIIDQKFEVRRYEYGKSGYEVIDKIYDVKYQVNYDENAILITEKKDGKDVKVPNGATASGNVLTITRLNDRYQYFNISAYWIGEDGEDQTGIDYWFPGRSFEFRYDDHGCDIFDDYEATVTLNTDGIGKFLDLPGNGIDYEIGYWDADDQWVDLTGNKSLYSIAGTSVTAYGDVMKELDIWHLDVHAVLIVNNEPYGRDDWCTFHLQESCGNHVWVEELTPATLKADGLLVQICTNDNCGERRETVIPKVGTVKLSKTSYTYNGKAQVPTVTVKDANGKAIAKSNYSVKYSNSKSTNAGKYTVTVTFKNQYSGSKKLNYTINQAANTLKIANATRKAKLADVKKKAVTVDGAKVSNKGQGTITYAKVKVDKNAANFTVNKKTGKITIKKGTAKGTYKVTVSAKAKGNTNYKASALKKAVVTIKIS